MDTTILIVEDKSILAHDLMDRLNQFGYENLMGPYESGEEASKACKKTKPDIAILDIQLKGKMTGIDLARELNRDERIPIIYLTQQQDDETFTDSSSTYPVAFINKPFTNNELRSAITNAARAIGKDQESQIRTSEGLEILDDRIFVRNGRGKFYIKLDDILWIKSNGETSTIMTRDRLELDPKLLPVVGHSLSKLELKLGFYPYLVRGSRYFIVNLKQVDRILDTQVEDRSTLKKALLIADTEISLGDKYRKSVMDRFLIV